MVSLRPKNFFGGWGMVATNVMARTTVIGAENLPHKGPAIIIANHTTMADPVVLLGMLNQSGLVANLPCGKPGCGVEGPEGHGHVRVLATELVFNNKVTGGLVRSHGMIPAGFKRASPESVRPTLNALEAGEIILIYPEGDVQTTDDGAPRAFRPGLAWLFRRQPVPIIPVAHHDSRRIGSGQFLRAAVQAATSVVRWPDVTVVIGKPIDPSEYVDLSAKDATSLVRSRLIQSWEAARDYRG